MPGRLRVPVLLCAAAALALLAPVPGTRAAEADARTIRLADVPADAPRFADYPATVYRGPQAEPDLRSDPLSRRYRTKLRAFARSKPNFAGHYIVATWGCGTGCSRVAIIDAKTGAVLHPDGLRSVQVAHVHREVLDAAPDNSPQRGDFGALHHRPDSRLLALFGTPEHQKRLHGISYFVMRAGKLQRIRFVAKR
jgi:hypothetical protein